MTAITPFPLNASLSPRHIKKLKVEIVLQFVLEGGYGDRQLVFRAVPNDPAPRIIDEDRRIMNVEPLDMIAEGDEVPVLVRVGQRAESRQAIIPSLVRLERAHSGHDLMRNLFAGRSQMSLKGRFGAPERETDASEVRRGVFGRGAGADGMIESVAQIVEGVGGHGKKETGEPLREPGLADILASVDVELYNRGIGVTVLPCLASSAKFLTVFPSPIK